MAHSGRVGIYANKAEWFIVLRWIAVLGGLLIILIAPYLVPLDIKYGKLVAVLVLVGLLNTLYLWYWKKIKGVIVKSQIEWAKKVEFFLHIQMGLDLLALSFLLFFSGGSNNPLVLFLLFHLAIGAILFDRKQSLPYFFVALFVPWLLFWIEPLNNSNPNLWTGLVEIHPEYQRAILWAYSLTVIGLWFFLTELAADLREKERELLAASDMLHLANDELKELDVYKNRFLKQVVVQLKEPVMEVGLELGKVEKSLSSEETRSLEAVDMAKKRIWALLQLIEDLVWLSRAQVKDIPFKREWLNVFEILRKCILEKEKQAAAKGIHFQIHGIRKCF